MAQYKDVDAIIEEIKGNAAETWAKDLGRGWWSHAVRLKDNIVALIKKAPTADVVEVVRCKDCFYFKDFGECNRSGIECMADDFCSYGERRDT